jgi:hypothetical protein
MRNVIGGAVAALLIAGCGASGGVRAARSGDRTAVAAYVAPLHHKGRLTGDEAARLARATLEHELSDAKGDEAAERITDARPCAYELSGALAARMKVHDDAGAAAAMALYEAGSLSGAAARESAADALAAWRSVGARALVRSGDGDLRRTLLTDGSPIVRRAAMRASGDAGDARDIPALLSAARLDPELVARSAAVRAIARIGAADDSLANALRDLWVTSDEALREDLASAYASPSIERRGGAEALRVLVASGHGPGDLTAAAALLRRGAAGDARSLAIGLLSRTIDAASRRHRSLAIAVAPLDVADLFEAVLRASKQESDTDVRISALARLLEVPASRAAAIRELEALAQPGDAIAFARRARAALAGAGQLSVQAWLEADLGSDDASVRLGAADSLAALGRAERAARLLSDADVRVRSRAACTMLLAARR